MVVEMAYEPIEMYNPQVDATATLNAFQSEITATEIINAYKAGKNIVFHFPADEQLSSSEAAVSMVGYFAEFLDESKALQYSPIQISEIHSLGENVFPTEYTVIDDRFVVGVVNSDGPGGGGGDGPK